MNPLGGPSGDCSALRVRQLRAGELHGAAREREAQHLRGCLRCQSVEAELASEEQALQREAPFPQVAAGVAEKLARQRRPARRAWAIGSGLAAAAAVAAVLAVGVRRSNEESADARAHEAQQETGAQGASSARQETRAKGAASAQLYVSDDGGHALRGELRIAQGARLRLSLQPADRRYAAAVLIEPGGRSVIFSGPARGGVLPGAFEWTGSGEARLVVAFADEPIDVRALPERAPAAAEILQLQLER